MSMEFSQWDNFIIQKPLRKDFSKFNPYMG